AARTSSSRPISPSSRAWPSCWPSWGSISSETGSATRSIRAECRESPLRLETTLTGGATTRSTTIGPRAAPGPRGAPRGLPGHGRADGGVAPPRSLWLDAPGRARGTHARASVGRPADRRGRAGWPRRRARVDPPESHPHRRDLSPAPPRRRGPTANWNRGGPPRRRGGGRPARDQPSDPPRHRRQLRGAAPLRASRVSPRRRPAGVHADWPGRGPLLEGASPARAAPSRLRSIARDAQAPGPPITPRRACGPGAAATRHAGASGSRLIDSRRGGTENSSISMPTTGRVRGGFNQYGFTVGILMLDTRFPRIPGDMGHAATFPFPVRYHRVPGASPELVVRRGAAGLLPAFVHGARQLAREGVGAVTPNCGFLVKHQGHLAAAVRVA